MSTEQKETVVASPEAWLDAKRVTGSISIESSDTQIEFPARAISFAERRDIETLYPYPERPATALNPDALTDAEREYLEKRGEAETKQCLAMIDLACMKIPGDTMDAKFEWATGQLGRVADVVAMGDALKQLSGQGMIRRSVSFDLNKVVVKDAASWAALTNSVRTCRSAHPGGAVLAFQCKPISQTVMKSIEKTTQEPPAPMKPGRTPTGMPGAPVPNPDDPAHKAKVAALQDLYRVLVLEAALGFQFPGVENQARVLWLHERPCWEVVELLNFVLAGRNNVRALVTDFTNG